MDPLEWLRAGLVTNPGVFVLGQPGTGKSTLVKRLLVGAVSRGTRGLVLGDSKPDYTALVSYLGGQVIEIGRGLDRINPLDSGPLGSVLRKLSGPDADKLRWEVRSRRLSLLLALCTLVREAPLSNGEEVMLGRAIDLLDERLAGSREPTVPDVLTALSQGPDELRTAARARSEDDYRKRTDDLVFTLDLLCSVLGRVFDGPTTKPIDLDAPIVSVDLRTGGAGDKLLTAAMLCTWSYSCGMVDAAAALAHSGWHRAAPTWGARRVVAGLRSAGLVEHADALTRLSRAKVWPASWSPIRLLTWMPCRPKQTALKRGLCGPSAITVMAGLPPRELRRLHEITLLTGPEHAMVAPGRLLTLGFREPSTRGAAVHDQGVRSAWSARGNDAHRGASLYDTDQAVRAEVS